MRAIGMGRAGAVAGAVGLVLLLVESVLVIGFRQELHVVGTVLLFLGLALVIGAAAVTISESDR